MRAKGRHGPSPSIPPPPPGGGGSLLPHRELTVTVDHEMLVDGFLCEAGALVNGTAISRVPLSELGDIYTVHHVETEAHEIILANGAPAETFVENVSRRAFDNYAEFEALYGEPSELKELPYPRAANARHLPLRIKNRLGIVTTMKFAKSAWQFREDEADNPATLTVSEAFAFGVVFNYLSQCG